MKNNAKKMMISGVLLIALFVVWTLLIQTVDVKPAGVNGTEIGLASVNVWFHSLTGVNMTLYTITDWLGLVPVSVCLIFGIAGFVQLIKRKNLMKVDCDIVISGLYYVIVIFCYLIFEMIPINYRPILINGFAEASYPSSTTLLVLCVMPTLNLLVSRRSEKRRTKNAIKIITVIFSAFTVIGRIASGVHWITDIAGSVLLSAGLYLIYKSVVLSADGRFSGGCYGVQ